MNNAWNDQNQLHKDILLAGLMAGRLLATPEEVQEVMDYVLCEPKDAEELYMNASSDVVRQAMDLAIAMLETEE